MMLIFFLNHVVPPFAGGMVEHLRVAGEQGGEEPEVGSSSGVIARPEK
jgi:hypothetical protein